ncbi:MAG: outer membrane beta-barrel domain-containing protein [Pseudomonadota bacterium]
MSNRSQGARVRRASWVGALLAVTTLGLAAPAAAAYDDEDVGGYAVVIQQRRFKLTHEFSMSAGIQPMNAYYKGAVGSFSYTLHFGDFQGWEIVHLAYSQNIETGVREEIFKWRAEPESSEFDALQILMASNYVLKPAYSKLALFNSTIVYSELFFNAGGGVAKYVSSWRPGLDYGVGIRFFVAEWFSVRLDIRHYLFLNGIPFLDPNAGVDNILFLSAGGSFNVGFE